jgi:XTP/dITP diphosphohydrolase
MLNPEDALERTNKKFIKRFQYPRKQRWRKTLNGYDFAEMDIFWEEAKKL